MAHTYRYAILRGSPDPRRGERVNVGIIVFSPDGPDVRFAELRKLEALTGQRWDTYVSDYKRRVNSLFVAGISDGALLKRVGGFEKVFVPSDFGWFDADGADEYEQRISEILSVFINKPSLQKRAKEQGLNVEIAKEFSQAKILATRDEGLDSHKVVRRFPIEDDLEADFVVKNGVYHVTATLDLRRSRISEGDAALKAVVLDRALVALGPQTRRLGVYALEAVDDASYHLHLHLLKTYSDEMFNWSDRDDRAKYRRQIYDAVNQ